MGLFSKLFGFRGPEYIPGSQIHDKPKEIKVVHREPEGSTGTDLVSGILSEEYLQTLTGTEAADIFDKMRRSDGKVKMVLQAVMNPIKGATWDVEPADDSDLAKQQADFVSWALFEAMEKRWSVFLHEILSMVPFGYSLFERIHKVIIADPTWGNRILYKSFAFRSQRTIEYWNVDECENLVSVTQFAFGDAQKRTVDMDARFLTRFSVDQEGNNFEGVSMLRPCYGPWLRKQTYLKLQAIGIEKFAVPTPTMEVPDGKYTSDQYDRAKSVLQTYTSHQSNFIMYPQGWKLDFANSNFDASKVESAIDREDTEIIDAFLANFLNLGRGASGGSYALSFDLSDFFLSGIEHIAENICNELNEGPIRELIDLNWGKQDQYPKMVCSGITDRIGQEFGNLLKALADSKYIVPDDKLEDHLRERIGLPKRSDEGQRKQEPKPSFVPGLSEEITLAERPSTQIKNDAEKLREVLKKNLTESGLKLVDQIVGKYKRLSESQKLQAIADQKATGSQSFKDDLKQAMALSADQALKAAKKEVPGAQPRKLVELTQHESVTLAEFERLPPKLQRQIINMSSLLVGTQLSDLEKAVFFQFSHSAESTQDPGVIEKDLKNSVNKYAAGASVVAAAGNTAGLLVNEARSAYFFDEGVSEEISAFKFVNGDPKSAVCQNLANRIFDKDDAEAARFMPPLHFNALLNGSQIDTPAGPRAIENIRVGDLVRTHAGRFKPVTEIMSKFEDKEYFVIELENEKTIKITGEHPVLTRNRGWVRADELTLSDNLVCSEDLPNVL